MNSQHSFNHHNPLHSNSITFLPGQLTSSLSFSEKNKSEEDLLTLKKQLRMKEANFQKEKAVLQQQVELLKMQLQESEEREINLKKMNDNIINSIKSDQGNTNKQNTHVIIDENHPDVQEILYRHNQQYLQKLQKEKESHNEIEYNLEKEIKNLQFKIYDLQRESESKDDHISKKNQEIQDIQEKQEDKLKYIENKTKGDCEIIINRLQQELDTINSDIDRQVSIRLNERYQKEQGLNKSIIMYQKEQQQLLTEQKELKSKIEGLENESKTFNERKKKLEDENGSLRYKLKQQEKKSKEELDTIKKQKEDAVKKLESTNKYRKSSTLPLKGDATKSRNTQSKQGANKENLSNINKSIIDYNENEEEEQTQVEVINKLKRQLSQMRCSIKKYEIEIKDLKSKHAKEIASLRDKLNVEKKKRMNIYEEKIDKNNSLLQDLLEKDQVIGQYKKQVAQLTDRLQYYCQGYARSNTPNYNGQHTLQDSIAINNLCSSMVDFTSIAQQKQSNSFSQKQILSPMRSLDLTLINNGSFCMIPLNQNKSKNKNKQSATNGKQKSPKQIKRNRVNSMKVDKSQVSTSISNMRFRKSKDASIAEVNEDLYKDSVDSHENKQITKFDQNDIQLPFPTRNLNVYAKAKSHRENFHKNNRGQKLTLALLNNEQEQKQDYNDSLENQSDSATDQDRSSFFAQKQDIKEKQYQEKNQQSQNDQLCQEKLEDEDCLVNILDNEDNMTASNLIQSHQRNQTSPENNMFKDLQQAYESLKSSRNQNDQCKRINRIPKPASIKSQRSKFQNSLSYNLQESFIKQDQSQINLEQSNLENQDQNKNLQSPQSNRQYEIPSSQSSDEQSNQRLTRNDSCPSPLDENETVSLIDSGKKFKVNQFNHNKMNQYQNYSQQSKNKFTQSKIENQNCKRGIQTQRNRTNSVINSVQDTSFRMKFIGDMETRNQQAKVNHFHQRVPSIGMPTNKKHQFSIMTQRKY